MPNNTTVKIVILELHSIGNEYTELSQYLRSKSHTKLSQNSLAIADQQTIDELVAKLRSMVKKNDYLMVFDLNRGSFSGNHNKRTFDWLKKSLVIK